MAYAKHLSSTTKTPQTKKAAKKQKKNDAGGYSFKIDKWARLERFIVLGCEGGSYYVNEEQSVLKAADTINKCLDEDYRRTIDLAVRISDEGRGIKNSTSIVVLALGAAHKDASCRKYALAQLSKVCRIGTHLFEFAHTVNGLRGWGRLLKEAVANWYLEKPNDKLVYDVTKYAARNLDFDDDKNANWSHRDVLRLSHPTTSDEEKNEIFKYIVNRGNLNGLRNDYLTAVNEIKHASPKQQAKMILHYRMPREVLPTEALNSVEVWEALLQNMPITAMVRNLGKMTQIGLLKPLSDNVDKVCGQLRNPEVLKRGRVHPFSLLLAYNTYRQGKGFRGSLTWNTVPQILDALEDAFYLSFQTVEPTNKKFLFGIDVSGSMSWAINKSNVSCAMAAGCLAMTSVRVEPKTYTFGFCDHFKDLGISKNDKLEVVLKKVQHNNFGRTDCAVPMVYATKNKLDVDVFVILTDSETYAGKLHPHQALEQYRQKTGKNSKLIVVGMTSNGFSIANPTDPYQLDMVGFDPNCPLVISEFAKME